MLFYLGADGSDESKTSACSDRLVYRKYFKCLEPADPAEWVFASRVDDGVCDCSDGSDESHWRSRCRDAMHIERLYAAFM
jgi:hypothetical protein